MRREMPLFLCASFVAIAAMSPAACTCSPTGGTSTSASASAAPSASGASRATKPDAAAEPDVLNGSDEIKPVYPLDAGPPDPLALRYCDAAVRLADHRRGECCHAPIGVGEQIVAQCVRTLTYALGSHAITLSEADLASCEEGAKQAVRGCDWVTPVSTPAPRACEGILKGQLDAKARCRSSLECKDGLRCQGLSAIDIGVCGPSAPERSRCDQAIDTLASFTRQDHYEKQHPECEGACNRRQCGPGVALGASCNTDRSCGAGYCAGGICVATLPKLGEACADRCGDESRCLKGTCTAPKAEGATCELDAECRGKCVREDAGTTGTCAMACTPTRLPVSQPVRPVRPPKRRR